MWPISADDATTAGLARYPCPPRPIRFCQFRLNEVIARCPPRQRVRPLSETGSAPRVAYLGANLT